MGLARIRRDVPDNEICDLYADGQSTYQIAKFYNVSPKTITWRLHRIGMQLRPSRRPKTRIIKEI